MPNPSLKGMSEAFREFDEATRRATRSVRAFSMKLEERYEQRAALWALVGVLFVVFLLALLLGGLDGR